MARGLAAAAAEAERLEALLRGAAPPLYAGERVCYTVGGVGGVLEEITTLQDGAPRPRFCAAVVTGEFAREEASSVPVARDFEGTGPTAACRAGDLPRAPGRGRRGEDCDDGGGGGGGGGGRGGRGSGGGGEQRSAHLLHARPAARACAEVPAPPRLLPGGVFSKGRRGGL
eukprot:COSAG01_NODE_1031_length_12014_cov_27.936131_14_plen_171_part_00